MNTPLRIACENLGSMAGTATSGSGHPQEAARPKVIYVMGSGRSGSTILGVALGNCDGVFYAGELDNWLARAGVPLHGGIERRRFWSEVRREMAGAEKLFGHDAQRLLERSFSLFRVHKWSIRRRLRADYRRVSEDLYRTIARVAGAEHVVDTAHFPLRGRELQALEGIDLYLIFLIRDPQSVVASFNLYLNRNDAAERWLRVLSTNANLWLTHALATLVFLRHPRARRMLLRHEDFLADPEGMLRTILDWSGSSAPLPDLTSLKTGFPINGNRLLQAEVVSLEPRASPPRGDSRLTALLQLPWRAVFSRLRPLASVAPTRKFAVRIAASGDYAPARR